MFQFKLAIQVLSENSILFFYKKNPAKQQGCLIWITYLRTTSWEVS